MRILLSHRYFWPDTAPYAFLLRAIGEDMAEAGHDVHVFASKPSYRRNDDTKTPKQEMMGPLNVSRTWVFQEAGAHVIVRALNVFLYCLGLFLKTLRLRPDVVTASSFPPVFAGYAAGLGARLVGSKFIYHMQDIHPEVSELSGGAMGRGIFAKIFRWLDNQTLRRASAIVVLSEDMKETLERRNIGELPIYVINNFALDSGAPLGPPPSEYAKPMGVRRVIFAGNIGRFQNLGVLTEGIAQCFANHPDLELFFLGDGKALADLKAQWEGNPQVRFAPFLPLDDAKPLIAEAEVGLVSLSTGIYKVAYPSKLLTYLGLGVPVLALTESESELAQSLTAAGMAKVPATDAPEDIANALNTLLEDPTPREDIKQWYDATFSRALSTQKWSQILDDIS